MNNPTTWTELTAQKLVRYEALFKLLDETQVLENIEAIARRVATQWKYCANVSSFRLVVPRGQNFQVIDGFRGDAQVNELKALSDWDRHHWAAQLPRQVRPADPPEEPQPPQHLTGKAIVEVQVLPFVRLGRCIGMLSAAARHEPFSELDLRFVRLLGGHFADRISDILLRQQAMEALISRATRDALTGLLNRGAIIERLGAQQALSRRTGQPLSTVIADIDFFKIINDSHGHLAGDEVLVEVSRRLQKLMREGDSLGRFGGEEFLFVLYPCDAADAARAAERFRLAIAQTAFVVQGGPHGGLPVSISLGVASAAAGDEISVQGLLKRADDALYRSKAEGRDRVTSAA